MQYVKISNPRVRRDSAYFPKNDFFVLNDEMSAMSFLLLLHSIYYLRRGEKLHFLSICFDDDKTRIFANVKNVRMGTIRYFTQILFFPFATRKNQRKFLDEQFLNSCKKNSLANDFWKIFCSQQNFQELFKRRSTKQFVLKNLSVSFRFLKVVVKHGDSSSQLSSKKCLYKAFSIKIRSSALLQKNLDSSWKTIIVPDEIDVIWAFRYFLPKLN